MFGDLANFGFGAAGALFEGAAGAVEIAVDNVEGRSSLNKSESSYSMGDGPADWVFSPD